MAFDPLKFSTLAFELVEPKKQPQEEHVRTSCGRAYYSAFLVARERLAKIGKSWGGFGSGIGVHGFVISTLKGSADGAVSGFGQDLSDLFDKRKSADYDLTSRYGFIQAFGALVAAGADIWIQDFKKIPDAQLKAACP